MKPSSKTRSKSTTKTTRVRAAASPRPAAGSPRAPRPPRRPTLTDRDRAVLDVLAWRVRCCTVAQLARAFWEDSPAGRRQCAARLKELSADGLTGTTTMLALLETELERPLATWQPGLPVPDFAAISHLARQRWAGATTRTAFVHATEAGATLVNGAAGRPPRASEATHDLHVAGVYFRIRQELPTRALSWRSEVLTARGAACKSGTPGDKVPDASVRDGKCFTAIEIVGEYSVDKLKAFHVFCQRCTLGYELW